MPRLTPRAPATDNLISFPERFGTPLLDGFGVRRLPSFSRQPVMDGTARYRSRAPRANYMVGIQWIFADQTFNEFKDFVQRDLSEGRDWFFIDLMLGTAQQDDTFDADFSFQTYVAHFAGSAYHADVIGHTFWQVTSTLELFVPVVLAVRRECDIYYPGTPADLAVDDVGASNIAALPVDVVVPCSRLYLPGNP